MQQRLHKYKRDPRYKELYGNRRITERSLAIIDYLDSYGFLPNSLLLHLAGGAHHITYRHLQMLYHRGFINRFAFPKIGNPGEFIYYLDNPQALELLIQYQWRSKEELDFERARRNREKDYSAIHDPNRVDEMQGRLMFLKHEVMISRFHGILELGCRTSGGKVELEDWEQGPSLWNKVEVPKLGYDPPRDGKPERWYELDDTENLPHRPDAFFTLRLADKPKGQQFIHFLYEADRKNTSTKKFNRKLRAHHYYIVVRRKIREDYGINRVRAVLIETLDANWANTLRKAANHPTVKFAAPSPLFWFTTSELLTKPVEIAVGKKTRRTKIMDYYQTRPEVIFDRIWKTPTDDNLRLSLLD